MQHLAILVNDAACVDSVIRPLLDTRADGRCTLVLCPPRLTHRIGKWLSQRQRQNWQRTWSRELQDAMQGRLGQARQDRLDWVVASEGPRAAALQLRRKLGTELSLLDVRVRRTGQQLPVADSGPAAQPAPGSGAAAWKAPFAISSGLAAVLALVD